MIKNNYIIAIDGPAGSGKSSTARELAKKLHYVYIDTGAMYRAITLAVIQKNIDLNDCNLDEFLKSITIELKYHNNSQLTILNGVDVSAEIRSLEVTSRVSEVSSIKEIREFLVTRQQILGNAGAIVMDGRDIGTVVFPNADFKFFLNASISQRAIRRMKELRRQEVNITYEELENQIAERDKYDSNREESPLRKADDAIEIDTTYLSFKEQVELLYNTIISRK